MKVLVLYDLRYGHTHRKAPVAVTAINGNGGYSPRPGQSR